MSFENNEKTAALTRLTNQLANSVAMQALANIEKRPDGIPNMLDYRAVTVTTAVNIIALALVGMPTEAIDSVLEDVQKQIKVVLSKREHEFAAFSAQFQPKQ